MGAVPAGEGDGVEGAVAPRDFQADADAVGAGARGAGEHRPPGGRRGVLEEVLEGVGGIAGAAIAVATLALAIYTWLQE